VLWSVRCPVRVRGDEIYSEWPEDEVGGMCCDEDDWWSECTVLYVVRYLINSVFL